VNRMNDESLDYRIAMQGEKDDAVQHTVERMFGEGRRLIPVVCNTSAGRYGK